MKIFSFIILCLGLIVLAGCGKKAQETNAQYILQLREKAKVVGENELSRFNAADLLYKNIPQKHSTVVPVIGNTNHIWHKIYRRYTDFEVLDIANSSSILNPVTFVISFKYDQFITQYRLEDDMPNAAKTSLEDSNFELQFSDSFIRYYLCKQNGDLIDTTPPLPLRALYFNKEGPGRLGKYAGEADYGVSPR